MTDVISPSAPELRCLLLAIGGHEPGIVLIIKERLAASHICRWLTCCKSRLGVDEYFLLLSWDNLENPRCSLHICPCITGNFNAVSAYLWLCDTQWCRHPLHPHVLRKSPPIGYQRDPQFRW